MGAIPDTFDEMIERCRQSLEDQPKDELIAMTFSSLEMLCSQNGEWEKLVRLLDVRLSLEKIPHVRQEVFGDLMHIYEEELHQKQLAFLTACRAFRENMEDEALRMKLESLAEFGFAIEPFGERTFLVRAVPALLADRNWSEVLRDLLDSSHGEAEWVERVAVTMACHSAVRAGQVMTDPEMRAMIKELEQVALPHSCPHGRPTMIYLSLSQLNSEFGRT